MPADAGERRLRPRLERRHLDVRSSCAGARHASRQPAFSSSAENARGSTEETGA